MNFAKMETWNQIGSWVLIFCLIFQSCCGFTLSESYPHYYTNELWVKLNHVGFLSMEEQIPFTFPFCEPQGGVEYTAESLGKFIMGYGVENSPYKLKMYTNESDIFLCRVESLSMDKINLLKESIDEMLHVNLVLDNLSAVGFTEKEGNVLRKRGYPVGFKDQDVYYLFNHLKFNVLVHKNEAVEPYEKHGYMVVGFEVTPCSVKHNVDSVKDLKMYDKYPSLLICNSTTIAMPIKEGQPIVFTYEVSFEESDLKWASRWDAYLKVEGAKVHWFAILNTLMGITFVAALHLLLFFWEVRMDFPQREERDEEARAHMKEESFDWFLVLVHVFRTPSNPSLLCVMVGNGVQILGMAIVSLVFAALGFMSLVSRQTLIVAMLLFYMIPSVAAGYVAVRLWATMNQKGWMSIALKTTCFFSFSFSMLVVLHFILWGIPSSISFIVIPTLVFCISVPLTLVGGYFGANAPFIQIPVETNAHPNNIPHQKESTWLLVPYACIFQFLLIVIELFTFMNIFKTSPLYYCIGFLFIALIHIVVFSAEFSVVATYFCLISKEDWAWWWKSFFASGGVAINLFIFSIASLVFELKSLSDPVFATKLAILWLGYSLFVVLAIMMATGTVGIFSSFCFVYYLYDAYVLEKMKSRDGIIQNFEI